MKNIKEDLISGLFPVDFHTYRDPFNNRITTDSLIESFYGYVMCALTNVS